MLIEINFSGYEKERDVPQTELTETFYLTMINQSRTITRAEAVGRL